MLVNRKEMPGLTSVSIMNMILIGFSLTLTISCEASNILVSPLIGKGSHFYLSAAIGEQLLTRGHNLTYLVSNAFEDHVRQSRFGEMFHYEVFKHTIPVEDIHQLFYNLSRSISSRGPSNEYMVSRILFQTQQNDCNAIIEDEILMTRLRSANFSSLLFDSTWVCGAIIAEVLNLPYFAVVPYPSPCFHTASEGSGFNPAIVPSIMTGFSSVMSFKERLFNSLSFLIYHNLGIQVTLKPYRTLCVKHGLPDPYDLMKQTKLWLVNNDFVGEYPCALPPNVIPVGGLTAKDPEQLPSDIESFIQGSGGDGIIICSFGSILILDESNMALMKIFVDAFARLPQRIIWLLKTSPPFPIPSSIKIVPWLSQNDLLGHPQTKAIFFHGGHNSYYEAIYHGVPAVVMPILADQHDVSSRVVNFGLGLKLDKDIITSDLIYEALHEVTSNSAYFQTAKMMSANFRNRPMKPAERAAFWIDHAIKHGTDNLELTGDSLNIFQYYLLDVIVFIFIVIFLSFYFAIKCIKMTFSKLYCFVHIPTKKKTE
ncbi:UDP-glucuronosyltransferase 2C1-like [Lytechinus variegatus]|uniref:UDP-glucuronosyltransferase 2C1-like n=1 Tax=Lytechinus variegatus TaxID=7654 RepID=UPI001BB12A33|nr:UDP-glucuronosyltransferase 2C1-like [Lytechinus variegatus]